jgi:hypothetical protein
VQNLRYTNILSHSSFHYPSIFTTPFSGSVLGNADSADERFSNNNNNNNNDSPGATPVHKYDRKGSYKLSDFEDFFQEAAVHPADCGSAMELPPWFDLDKFKK